MWRKISEERPLLMEVMEMLVSSTQFVFQSNFLQIYFTPPCPPTTFTLLFYCKFYSKFWNIYLLSLQPTLKLLVIIVSTFYCCFINILVQYSANLLPSSLTCIPTTLAVNWDHKFYSKFEYIYILSVQPSLKLLVIIVSTFHRCFIYFYSESYASEYVPSESGYVVSGSNRCACMCLCPDGSFDGAHRNNQIQPVTFVSIPPGGSIN